MNTEHSAKYHSVAIYGVYHGFLESGDYGLKHSDKLILFGGEILSFYERHKKEIDKVAQKANKSSHLEYLLINQEKFIESFIDGFPQKLKQKIVREMYGFLGKSNGKMDDLIGMLGFVTDIYREAYRSAERLGNLTLNEVLVGLGSKPTEILS